MSKETGVDLSAASDSFELTLKSLRNTVADIEREEKIHPNVTKDLWQSLERLEAKTKNLKAIEESTESIREEILRPVSQSLKAGTHYSKRGFQVGLVGLVMAAVSAVYSSFTLFLTLGEISVSPPSGPFGKIFDVIVVDHNLPLRLPSGVSVTVKALEASVTQILVEGPDGTTLAKIRDPGSRPQSFEYSHDSLGCQVRLDTLPSAFLPTEGRSAVALRISNLGKKTCLLERRI